jgi:hypothetical protein
VVNLPAVTPIVAAQHEADRRVEVLLHLLCVQADLPDIVRLLVQPILAADDTRVPDPIPGAIVSVDAEERVGHQSRRVHLEEMASLVTILVMKLSPPAG